MNFKSKYLFRFPSPKVGATNFLRKQASNSVITQILKILNLTQAKLKTPLKSIQLKIYILFCLLPLQHNQNVSHHFYEFLMNASKFLYANISIDSCIFPFW